MSEEMYVFVKRWPLLEFDELEVSPYDFQILASINGFNLVFFFFSWATICSERKTQEIQSNQHVYFHFELKTKKVPCVTVHFLVVVDISSHRCCYCRVRCWYWFVVVIVVIIFSSCFLLLWWRHRRRRCCYFLVIIVIIFSIRYKN